MGRVDAFAVPGVELWFNSSDHLPPHFHASQVGEWEVPFDTDPDWPPALQAALTAYRTAWRAKMDEINGIIAASAPQETLVDQPRVVSGVLRVSGPFTVEGIQPVEQSLDLESPIEGVEGELDTFALEGSVEPQNAAAFVESMVQKMRRDGVRFPDNKVQAFTRLELLANHPVLHAEGEWLPSPGRLQPRQSPSRAHSAIHGMPHWSLPTRSSRCWSGSRTGMRPSGT